MDTGDIITASFGLFGTILGTFVGWRAALITTSKSQKNDQNIHAQNLLKDHYSYFWDDPDLRKVRWWLASDTGYSYIQDILKNRLDKKGVNEWDEEEYLVLDQIDKFINTVMLVNRLYKGGEVEDSTWKELRLHYWIAAPNIHKRVDFTRYLEECYRESFFPEWQDISEKWIASFSKEKRDFLDMHDAGAA